VVLVQQIRVALEEIRQIILATNGLVVVAVAQVVLAELQHQVLQVLAVMALHPRLLAQVFLGVGVVAVRAHLVAQTVDWVAEGLVVEEAEQGRLVPQTLAVAVAVGHQQMAVLVL
jgi:hypothetical protein